VAADFIRHASFLGLADAIRRHGAKDQREDSPLPAVLAARNIKIDIKIDILTF